MWLSFSNHLADQLKNINQTDFTLLPILTNLLQINRLESNVCFYRKCTNQTLVEKGRKNKEVGKLTFSNVTALQIRHVFSVQSVPLTSIKMKISSHLSVALKNNSDFVQLLLESNLAPYEYEHLKFTLIHFFK